MFKHKAFAVLVAYMTGVAEVVTDDQLIADVGFSAAEPMDTEVVGVIEGSPVPGIEGTMEFHLFGDRGGILAEVSGDVLKGRILIQCLFDVLAVIEG